MMRMIPVLGAVGLFAAGAFAEENPFMKPQVRREAPVIQPITPQDPSMGLTPQVTPVVTDGAVVDAKLIAVINGEEVWLKKNDKTYVRQKARSDSLIKLRESSEAEASEHAEVLPVIPAGRPSNPQTPRQAQ